MNGKYELEIIINYITTPHVLSFDLIINFKTTPMKKDIEALVNVPLTKPVNLDFSEKITLQSKHFVVQRKEEGNYSPQLTSGKRLIKYIPTLYYFIHILMGRQYSKNKAFKHPWRNDYIRMFTRDIEPLKSKSDFQLIMMMLRNMGITEVISEVEPNKYKTSANAYYFKLKEPYFSSKVIQHEIQIKKIQSERIEKSFGKKVDEKINNDNNINLSKDMPHQYYAVSNIRFEGIQAKKHIEELINVGTITTGAYNSSIVTINNIQNNRITFSKSDVCNRYYTSVTGMPKVIRPYIKDNDGNSLIELDFGSFNAFAVYRIINEWADEVKTPDEQLLFKKELELYTKFLLSNDFYMALKDEYFAEINLSRDNIKDIVLHNWFNGTLKSRDKYKKVMDSSLPFITKIINTIKEKDYKSFSHLTMMMESQLVNDIIYNKFITLHPDAVLYTIFDCIMIEQKHADELHKIMLELGTNYFGIQCRVKVISHISSVNDPNAIEDINKNNFIEDSPPKDEDLLTEEKLRNAYNRIFGSMRNKPNEDEQYPKFVDQIDKLPIDEAKLLVLDADDINDSITFWKQGTLDAELITKVLSTPQLSH